MEEKYKKAMVSNAQLDNDKANLIYQVDTLKDVIEEMEEQMSEMKRELEDKSKVMMRTFPTRSLSVLATFPGRASFFLFLSFQELERQKHTCTVLQHKQEELKEGIRQRDELIEVNHTAACVETKHTFLRPHDEASCGSASRQQRRHSLC